MLAKGEKTEHFNMCVLGFLSRVGEVSVRLRYDTVSLGDWFPTFRDHYVVSKRREPITLWRGIISQKKGNFKFRPVRIEAGREGEANFSIQCSVTQMVQ
jgi:hypothetical protein